MSDYFGFGRNDSDVKNNGRIERYKGKENHTDRIGFVWLFKDENGEYEMDAEKGHTPRFVKANAHYVQGMGQIKPVGEYTTQKFGPPKMRMGTYIIKYATDRNGKVKTPFSYELMKWEFTGQKWEQLANTNDEFPLIAADIKVTCNGEQYQKLSFTPCAGEALWRRDPDICQEILAKVAQLGNLELARTVTIEEIKAKLGEAEEVVGDTDEDLDFDSLMGGIS